MKLKIVFYLLILVALVVGFFILENKSFSSHIVEEPNKTIDTEPNNTNVDWDWVKDNCDCIERERLFCGFEGFVLNEDGYCYKEKEFTNPLRGCSKYNCTGEIYVYGGE